MLINLRNALMSGKRLPYDAEVEWLESTGTQYIELPFNSTTDGFCDFDITYQMSALNLSPPFGYRYGASARYGIWNGTAGEYYVGANASHSVLISQNTSVNTLSLRNGQYVDYNGTQTAIGTGTVRSNIGAILFGFVSSSSGATSRSLTSAKIQAFKLYNVSGILLFDGIPVRVGTVGYLYDRVTRKLFGNAGTGDFVLGPDVVPVEYIESHGTEWIDTELDYFADFEVGIKLRGSVVNKALGTSGTMCLERYSASVSNWLLNVNNTKYPSNASIVDYHVMSWKGGVFAADGVTVHTVSNPFSSGNMMLFGAGYPYPNMIYACKLWDANGIPVRSFRPVRVGTDATSWEGAMMDVLTRRIYRNQGTGAFAYGNDLKYPIPAE